MTGAMSIWKNKRVFFLGVNTGYVLNGEPDDSYVEFYRRRASPKLHCAIVGNVVVPGGHGSNEATPTLTRSGIWRTVAEAITAQGCLPGIQLATTWEGYSGNTRFVGAKHGQFIAAARALVESLGAPGVENALRAFDKAAQMAVEHGFLHVQFHAAHGYLLSLLVDERINPNAEQVLYGLSEIVSRLACAGVESSIRISLRTGDEEFDAIGSPRFHDRIAGTPFDYVDLSSGFYNIDKRLIYPSSPEVRVSRVTESCVVAERHPQKGFILSGLAGKDKKFELPSNLHVGLCRDLIANPDFLEQPNDGCRNRNKCHYFSRGEKHLTCAVWEAGE